MPLPWGKDIGGRTRSVNPATQRACHDRDGPFTSAPTVDSRLLDYPLPQSAIAQEPLADRDAARLFCVYRDSRRVEHRRVRDLPGLLPPGTALFRNNVSVLRARLAGKRPGGGAVECLLVRPGDVTGEWWCLVKPGRRLGAGARFTVGSGHPAEVVAVEAADGARLVRFETGPYADVESLAEAEGIMPLPPYIERAADDPRRDLDAVRYQTVYADPGERRAVAAPTAGLHFTDDLIARTTAAGHRFHDLTLRVGPGTFRPVRTENVLDHPMHTERYRIGPEVRAALRASGPKLAVGTTALRAIEDWWRRGAPDPAGPFEADADIFITPPADFHVDALLTNFHLPRSTLLCLVSAFLLPGRNDGIEWLKALYAEAVDLRYRFFSYGDAMLILDDG